MEDVTRKPAVKPTRFDNYKKALLAVILFAAVLAAWFFLTSNPHKEKSFLDLLVEYRTELEYPGLTIEEAARNLETPEAVYRFVRDRTVYSPYFGRRQSPETVLRSRIGNSADRSFLLGALLEAQGWEVGYYYENDHENIRSSGSFEPVQSEVLEEITRRLDLDPEEVKLERKEMIDNILAKVEIMQGKVGAVRQALNKFWSNSYSGWAEENPDTRRVFVTADKEGEDSLYFDPTFPDSAPIDSRYAFGKTPPHGTGIELWMRGADGTNTQLLNWVGETAGRDISLNFFSNA